MEMSRETSAMPPPGEDDSNSSKLKKLFLDEKQKTSLVIIRIARLNLLLGVLLFIALTIGGSVSWERSVTSMIGGYFFSFLMIGISICMLSVYGINFMRKKKDDNLLDNNQENVWTPLSWRKENEIQKNVLENKFWFWSLGSLILIFSLLICCGEAAFLALGLNKYIFLGKYQKGLSLGLSSLFILTSVMTFVSVKQPGRKIFLILFFLGLLAFVGSVVLTVVSSKNSRYCFTNIRSKLTMSTEDEMRSEFAHNSDGHIYFPFWPYFPLWILMFTPPVTIIVLSLALMLFCLKVLIRFQKDKIEEFCKNDSLDVAFVTAGIALPVLGFGVHLLSFILSIVTNIYLWDDGVLLNHQSYFGFFIFTFTGLSALICVSQPKSQFSRFVLFLLSVSVFAVSIFMIIQQTKFYVNQDLDSEIHHRCENSTKTDEFCLWEKDIDEYSRPRECVRSSVYDSNYLLNCKKLICIPLAKKCDGVIDMLPSNQCKGLKRCEEDTAFGDFFTLTGNLFTNITLNSQHIKL